MNLIDETINELNDNKTHNLIIIGNGFDLNCGLQTSYKDYFSYRESEIRKLDAKFIELIKNNQSYLKALSYFEIKVLFNDLRKFENINIWDIVFFSNLNSKIEQWCDVETVMFKFLNNRELQTTINEVHTVLQYLIDDIEEGLWQNTIHKSNHIIASLLYRKNSYEKLFYEDIFTELLLELKLFEENFLKFIKNQNIGSHYWAQAHLLLEKINFNQDNYKLINFNYTRPDLNYRKSERHNLLTFENVHGDISNKNIIFGIDQTELDNNSKIYMFSKTSRKIFNSEFIKENNAVLSKGINNIIIYGHSLNVADISYYISVFDFVELYDSHVNLYFYYSIYDQLAVGKIKSEKYKKVIDLINAYSKHSEQHNGKNLIHKLLLENRLHILEL